MQVLGVGCFPNAGKMLLSRRIFQVLDGCVQGLYVVPCCWKKAAIAELAEEAANPTSLMVVVNVETLTATSATDGTLSSLCFEEFIVLSRLETVRCLYATIVCACRRGLLLAVGTGLTGGGGEELLSPAPPTLDAHTPLDSGHRFT